MSEPTPVESLQAFQERAFARHMLVDLPFPVAGTIFVVLVCSGLLHGKVPVLWIALWVLFTVVTLTGRWIVERGMRSRIADGSGHGLMLRQVAWLSLPTGAISGFFACLYFDAQDPVTMVVLATYMTVVVVGAVVPTSVYLPAFYLLVLPAHLPYMVVLWRSGAAEHLVLIGLNLLFLLVTAQYARAAHRMHCEGVRLRYDNLQLIKDLGERRADAESASRTKSLFLAGVSHDLKQPIRALGLYLGVLEHAEPESSAGVLKSVTPKMAQTLRELHGQVTRLLELSRLESGALTLQVVPVALPELFAGLHALFDSQALGKGVHLRFADLGRLRSKVVWVDPRMLESILQNLISNAINHAGHGVVYVGVRRRREYRDGHQLCIEVRDNGCGIPLERQPHLFDAYRSFDDRKASESHGLGLAIARAQATYLGASMVVKSAPGRGSVFTVCGLSTRDSHLERRVAVR